MITLESVEAVNIRSLGSAFMQPLPTGVTALNGPRGVGKSSLLITVLWVLYGVTPDGVTVQALRRQGTTGPVKGVVTLLHDGQRVVVERGLKGRNDTPYVQISVDGVLQSVNKVRVANAWITSRFGGLDAQGFTAAFVTRQKELDTLVKATAGERRRLIERLAGIDRMSAALKAAREEEADTKRTLELLPGSPDALAAARSALEAAQQVATAAWERRETSRAAAAADEEDLARVAERAAQVAERVEAHRRAHDAAQRAGGAQVLADERAAQATRDVQRLREASRGGDAEQVAAARAAHERAVRAERENRAALEAAQQAGQAAAREQQRAQQAAARLQQRTTAAEDARQRAERAAARTAGAPEDLDAQAQAAQARADELTERTGALRGEYARLSTAIKTLQASSDPTCPTCLSALPDARAIVETLAHSQQRVGREGQQARAESEAAAQRAEELRRRSRELSQARTAAEHAAEQARTALAELEQARTAAEQAEQDAAAAAEHARRARAAAASAQEAQQAVTAEVQRTAGALRRAESAAEAAAELAGALARAEQARGTAERAAAEAAAASAAEAAARVPEEERVRARAAHQDAQVRAAASARAAGEAQADHRIAEEQVRGAERARDAEAEKLRLRAATVAELERRTAVRDALDAFRRDRIARLAPEVSEVATDLVSRITGGRFVSVVLDEEFTPVVTDDTGTQRPVQWLSGGEESAVALALRVALSDLWSGRAGGLFWLDEPFVSQDVASRAAMMAAIRELPGRQVILINHASEATDLVDLVLDVVPDDVGGSRIEEASSYGPVSEAALDEGDDAGVAA
ncbi:hypothetical protein [Kineococcus sp. SYSU DK005]|uniref:hypothetical protein n=1 Tax=Kineococcus sp. SYSU DK005 TaxID=3383126 RepID=UPI003D7CAEFF